MKQKTNPTQEPGMILTKTELNSYDTIIIAFSGGKDSMACVLNLLEAGADKDRIELWHHDVDGEESDLMDWASTRSYCRKFAEALGVKIYFSWKVGGFEREMLRENALTAPTRFECPDGTVGQSGGLKGKPSTRRMFPQVTADLSVRWCSAYLKIDVCATAIRNQARFIGKRTLVVSGERAEESPARSNYEVFEADRSDGRNAKRASSLRHVDRYRAVHGWTEQRVWDVIKRWKIQVHPAYRLGWGRLSCAACIFGSKDQWASLNAIDPKRVEKISNYEKEFDKTIQRKESVMEQVEKGTPYTAMNPELVELAMSEEYTESIFTDNWEMPAGAFGESCPML